MGGLRLLATLTAFAACAVAHAAPPLRPGIAITNHSSDAGASLVLRGAPGHAILVEASTNLIDWSVIESDTLDGSGGLAFIDLTAKTLESRFYRGKDLDSGSLLSSNVVGFISISVRARRTPISNPFLSSNNTVGALLPEVPNGVSLYKVAADGEPTVNNFLFAWSDAAMTLLPGEGALLHNPSESSFVITLKGEIVQGATTNTLMAGEVLASSVIARAGVLDADLALPTNGDIIVERLIGEGYDTYPYSLDSGMWDSVEPPYVELGEAILIRTYTNTSWGQNFTVTEARTTPYMLTNHALASRIPNINFTTYNISNALGRVFDTDAITPLPSSFRGQLYAGTNANAGDLVPVGSPASFLSGASEGYIRSGLVPIPNLPGEFLIYLQLRVWDAAGGSTYEMANNSGSKAGLSQVFSANARVGISDPPSSANNFPSFSLSGTQIIVIKVNGQAHSTNAVAAPAPARVEIVTAFPDGNIFYTLDGSPPAHGSLYLGPFLLNRSAMIRAVAYTADFRQSVDAVPFALTILQPPLVLEQPGSQLVPASGTAGFAVRVSGSEPLYYQWRRNGANLPGANGAALLLSNVQLADSGSYTVVITNILGTVTSTVASLSVWMPPTVTVVPAVTNVPLHASVTFRAQAGGSPPLLFQWRKNGVNIPGATNDTYTIADVQLADGGSYSVVVANEVDAVTSAPALLLVEVISQAPPSDHFTNRLSLVGASGFAAGTNQLATREPDEPRHAGKFGSNSVWYSWTAPSNGIATFRTAGSTFDTLLGIYTGASVNQLARIAGDEDRAGFLTSELRFNALTNVEYQVAIDGFAGQQGVFTLSWELEPTSQVLPVITNAPASQTVTQGATVTLSVGATGTGLSYQWYFNNASISGATTPTLQLTDVRRDDVGYYTVAITNGSGRGVVSLPAALEMGTEPGPVVQDKFEDWVFGVESGGRGLRFAGAGAATTSPGYQVGAGGIGSHLFSNATGTTSTNEANHCGQIINATMWLFIEATTNGTLLIDTRGSAVPTVMAAYVYDLDAGLKAQIICATTNATDGVSSTAGIVATAGTTYAVVADGLNRATGQIQLNWALGRAPEYTNTPNHYLVKRGSRLMLSGGISTGFANNTYQWWLNGTPLPGATNTSFILANVQPADAGVYAIHAGNVIGTVMHEIAIVEVDPIAFVLAESTFDRDSQGWNVDGDVTNLTFQAGLGNLGGCLQAFDRHLGPTWYWVAPSNYLGNWSGAYGGWLQFDLKQSATTGLTIQKPDVVLTGGGLTLVFNTVTNPGTIWASYKVPLHEAKGWMKANGSALIQAEMLQVLSGVTGLRIRGEFSTVADIGWLDNVALIGLDINSSPSLLIQAGEPNQVVLEWPANALGFRLMHSSNLSLPWFTNPPPGEATVEHGVQRMRLPASLGQQFFRLRKP